jgi:S1-C subfamily serine protease
VRGADDIRIVLNDKREFSAQIITEDPSSDLAFLQIDNKEQVELPKINIADSDVLEVGDLVLAIGNPFGVGQTVTSGIVSGLARTAAGVSDYNFFIQTDAAINPGNSGGALVDMNGELVGINTAIYSKSGGSVGVGFAIPARMVEALLKNRKPDGSLIRPYFGATFQDINAEIARSLGLKRVSGVLVDEVASSSPAANAGITSGDVIVAFNDKAIDSAAALQFRIGTAEIAQPLNITYIRQGSVIDRKITLIKTPKSEHQNEVFLLKGNHPLNGVAIVTLTPKLAKHLGISAPIDGVVVVQIVNNNGRIFVRTGDIITECNGLIIRSSADLQKALSKYNNNTISITIIRNGNVMQLRMSN